ncbi:hypothetical protein BDW74DRAFT_177900 [Aspergillus multicolor]|uniref:uncharacterized protein n=1 Tax=Aspergillus multicolor TaxID=41759 RepID=UPI003CCC96F4
MPPKTHPGIPIKDDPEYPPNAQLQLWWTRSNYNNGPEHWALFVLIRGTNRCTRYEAGNGYPPETYEAWRQEDKRFSSWFYPRRELIADFSRQDHLAMAEEAAKVKPQHCQRYIVDILQRLEDRRMVPLGTAEKYRARVQLGLFEGPNGVVSSAMYQGWVEEKGEDEAKIRLREFQGYRGKIDDPHLAGKFIPNDARKYLIC